MRRFRPQTGRRGRDEPSKGEQPVLPEAKKPEKEVNSSPILEENPSPVLEQVNLYPPYPPYPPEPPLSPEQAPPLGPPRPRRPVPHPPVPPGPGSDVSPGKKGTETPVLGHAFVIWQGYAGFVIPSQEGITGTIFPELVGKQQTG